MIRLGFLTLTLFIFSAFGLSAQNWETDIEIAQSQAVKQNRPIVLVFQGSDWCAPCIKLEKEIWSTEEFQSYANEHFVMLKADFPKRSKNALDPKQQEHNNKLAQKFNQQGYFPLVVVLDKNGKLLGKTGYKKTTPENFIATLESFHN